MSVECAACDRYACRVGRIAAVPEACPMRGPFPRFDALYSPESLRLLYQAARIEGEGYGRWTRLRETAELARRMGWSRLGVAHCADTRPGAERAAEWFGRCGLDVVLPPWTGGCDPRAQATCFGELATDLNVVVGMCVGHDALFVRHSTAPVTCLVVPDERLRHNPVAALYTRTGYLKSALYGRIAPGEGGAGGEGRDPRPWDDATLERLAEEVRAARVGRDPPPCRIEEIMDFANRAGARHLGLVFCSGFRQEARHLRAILGTNGFRVSSACCKTGSVPKERIGILDSEKVRPGGPEMTCNPAAQAALLEREVVDLVLLMGQCVGHDTTTLACLRTPTVFVVAKDRVLAHNTTAALYDFERPLPLGSFGGSDGHPGA